MLPEDSLVEKLELALDAANLMGKVQEKLLINDANKSIVKLPVTIYPFSAGNYEAMNPFQSIGPRDSDNSN